MKMYPLRRWSVAILGLAVAMGLVTYTVGHAQSRGFIRRAQRLLETVKLVDGDGSGLDADTLRGLAPSELEFGGPMIERVAQLEERIGTLERLLASASLVHGGQTLRFSGINLQIVGGQGQTDVPNPNGLGNLIVGYNESRGVCDETSGPTCEYPLNSRCGSNDEQDCVDNRWGSHNVIVGMGNNYASYGGIVAGKFNAIHGPCSSVTAGKENVAEGAFSGVSGGRLNRAAEEFSSVSGGKSNHALGRNAWIGGGHLNLASGTSAVVCGGVGNNASGLKASIAGGGGNQATGHTSSVGGGNGRSASGLFDWAAGSLLEDE